MQWFSHRQLAGRGRRRPGQHLRQQQHRPHRDIQSALRGELIPRVVALVAVCDLTTPQQRYDELREQGWSSAQAHAEAVQFARGIHCTVQEIACTSESAAIPLRGPLGWGSQARRMSPAEQWRRMSTESMTHEVHNVVLPDDAERTGDDHPWSEFVATLAQGGVHVTARELADVPYIVVFASRLHGVLSGVGIEAATALPFPPADPA